VNHRASLFLSIRRPSRLRLFLVTFSAMAVVVAMLVAWQEARSRPVPAPRQDVVVLKREYGWLHTLAVSPDGKNFVSDGGMSEGTHGHGGFYVVTLQEVATGRTQWVLRTERDDFTFFRFSADGKTILGLGDWSLCFLDSATGQLLNKVDAPKDLFWSVSSMTADCSLVAWSCKPGIRLWDVATRKEVALLPDLPSSYLAFSPDGKLLASARKHQRNADGAWDDGPIPGEFTLWDVNTRRKRATLNGDTVAYSPDGRTLATQGMDRTIKLWNTTNGQLVSSWNVESYYAHALAFSPDGTKLASSTDWEERPGGEWPSVDGIKFWDVATGRELRRIATGGDYSSVCCLVFSRDGGTLVAGRDDGTVLLVKVP
jgi:WD40 repeat protein